MAAQNNHGHHEHHIVPKQVYMNVFYALIVLTVITVAAARVDFGFLNTFIAIGIATVKAGLVAAYFMGLKYDEKLNVVIFVSGFFFLLVLFFFSQLDIITRIFQSSTL